MESLWTKCLKTMGLISLFGVLVYADTNEIGAPTDGQIVKIIETANDSEIDTSKLAKKSGSPQVQALAKAMVDAHAKSNGETVKLARNLSLRNEDSQISDDIKKDSKEKLAQLKILKGADFDKAYLDDLIGAHETVLDTLNNTLIPSAKDPHLKSLLVDTRVVVEAHLEHAKTLQAALNK